MVLIYADDVNILGGSIQNKNTEALVVATREIGLEVNADETKYMVNVLRSECRTKSQYKD